MSEQGHALPPCHGPAWTTGSLLAFPPIAGGIRGRVKPPDVQHSPQPHKAFRHGLESLPMNNEFPPSRNDIPAGDPGHVSRRGFVAAAGSVVAAVGVLADPVARMAHAAGSDRLKVGLVGCGGRGTGAASQAISADPGVVLWALADAFGDQVKAGASLLGRTVEEKPRTTRLSRLGSTALPSGSSPASTATSRSSMPATSSCSLLRPRSGRCISRPRSRPVGRSSARSRWRSTPPACAVSARR